MAAQVGGELGAAMATFAKNPQDAHAIAVLSADPGYNGIIHHSRIPTMLGAGHATEAAATARRRQRCVAASSPAPQRSRFGTS